MHDRRSFPGALLPWLLAAVAACDGGTGSVAPPEPEPVPSGITVTPAQLELEVGDSGRFTAQVLDQNGAPMNALIEWSSSAPLVATVDGAGGVQAHGAGSAVVHARSGTAQGQGVVAVTAPPVNQPPAVAISEPADGATVPEGTAVTLRGSANDPEDGALSGESLRWTSDRDGMLGTGGTVIRDDLSVGIHLVVLTATDPDGATASAGVRITVSLALNQAPVAAITSPEDGATILEGTPLVLTGTATDPEEGELSGASLTWRSDRDGELGTGTSVTRADLSVGVHAITLTAADARGAEGRAAVGVTVAEPPSNQPPVVTITAPAHGASFEAGVSVTMTGSAEDPEDGPVTGSDLVWSSDIDGTLGEGASLSRDDLGVGTHTLTLTATDGAGATGSAGVSVIVTAAPPGNQPPLAAITAPANGASFQAGSDVRFQGSGSDPEDGALDGSSLRWRSDRDGELGTGGDLVRSDLTIGTHRITLRATDTRGASHETGVTVGITAPPAGPASVELTPDYFLVDQGAQASPFTVTVRDGAGNVIPGAAVAWTTTAPGVVGVSATGTISGVAGGTAEVIATAGAASARARIGVAGPGDPVVTALLGGAGTAEIAPGSQVAMPVAVDLSRVSPTGDLGAAQFDVTYDAALLEAVSVAGTSGYTVAANLGTPGKIIIAVLRVSPVGTPAFDIASVTFRARSDAPPGGAGTIDLAFVGSLTATSQSGFATYPAPVVVGGGFVIR